MDTDRPYTLTDLADMERKRRMEERAKPETWPRPIPVSERMPKLYEKVLLYYTVDGWGTGWLDSDVDDGPATQWYLEDACAGDYLFRLEEQVITHWLPLPPKPE